MKKCYVSKNFRDQSRAIIQIANQIIEEYEDQGFTLTLRQLYYQFVARDIIPNKQAWYDKLGSIINDARLAGLISWDALEDRTRNIRKNQHWNGIDEILEAAKNSYRIDTWSTQPTYVEVWIEKDALVGVIEDVCERMDVTYFSCRGYTSASEMYKAGERMNRAIEQGRRPIVLHLGDHDPSGIDMTFDIWKRLNMFAGANYKVLQKLDPKSSMHVVKWDFIDDGVEVRRLGLNREQIEQFSPPPNPAKVTDSRSKTYIQEHGYESWELDSLSPRVLSSIIDQEVRSILDLEKWEAQREMQRMGRKEIGDIIEGIRS